MVAGELPHLAGEDGSAVRKEDLGLADAARVKKELSWGGIARVILEAEVQLEGAKWNPGRLPAPARLDDAVLERKHRGELRAGLWRELRLQPRLELQGADGDPDPAHVAILTVSGVSTGPRPY